jgi:hypothetical protein
MAPTVRDVLGDYEFHYSQMLAAGYPKVEVDMFFNTKCVPHPAPRR